MACGTSPEPEQVDSPRHGSAEAPADQPQRPARSGDEPPGQSAPVSPACDPPEGFEDLQQTTEGVAFDIRYATSNNFTGSPLPGYEKAGAWGIEGLGAALDEVAIELEGHGFVPVIYDAYRPPQASTAMVAFARDSGRQDWLRDGYIAAKSNHARGTTVDLGLRRVGTDEDVDMGTPFDTFSPSSHYRGVKGEAFERRTLLRRAMTHAGFVPYEAEWWHFELSRDPRPPRRPGTYACPPPVAATPDLED